MKALVSALVVCLLGAAGPAQAQLKAPNAAGGVQPAKLPADWAQRDLEGKWVAYRAALQAGAADTTTPAAWAMALGAAEEWDLLEWIAIFEGWRHAGPQLAKAEAPQLLRVAVWNLGAFDSHNKDTARAALTQRAAVALGWFEAHPAARRGKAESMAAELAKGGAVAADAAKFLPPLEPMQVLVPLLDAPAALAEFGDRLAAEPRVRYVHQVLRGLGGVLVLGEADDLIVQKVLTLCRHGSAAVRSAAFTTLSKLPGGSVPYQPLRRMAADAKADPELRRLATGALSFSAHPLAFFDLHAIALDAAHPATDVAIVRLGEIGDDTTAAALQGFVVDDLERGKRIGAALAAIERRKQATAFLQPGPMSALFWRVAWLRVTKDPRAAEHATAVATLLRAQGAKMDLGGYLEPYTQTAIPGSPFRGDEAAQVDKAVAGFVQELLRGK